jgi:hypothetical protein
MSDESQLAARERVMELAADARYRPFVVGYLLSCLDERHWQALVDAAIEFTEANIRRRRELESRIEGMPGKRG